MVEIYMKTATDIVSAYVSHNSVRSEDLLGLIKDVHAKVVEIANGPAKEASAEKPQPLMPWKKTIHNDYLISLEDGKKYQTLKRHITKSGMTVAEYREKWGLPDNYPVTAKNYSERRSTLARSLGLGRKPAEEAKIKAGSSVQASKPEMKKAKGRAHSKGVQTRKRAGTAAGKELEVA